MVFLYYLRAKKKFDKIFIKANATTPYPKNIKAFDVISTSFNEKDPYPNNPLTISSDAIIKPKLAGIENSKDNCNDLFCMLDTLEKFLDFKRFR